MYQPGSTHSVSGGQRYRVMIPETEYPLVSVRVAGGLASWPGMPRLIRVDILCRDHNIGFLVERLICHHAVSIMVEHYKLLASWLACLQYQPLCYIDRNAFSDREN